MLSVIIPAYNEELMIEKAYFTISDILKNADIENEIIFVDDGSSDNTYERIKTLADKESNISGLHFSRNFGKEAAISAGLAAAEGDAVVVIDCDLQHPPEVIPEMYALWQEGYEIVEGIKNSRGKEGIFHKLFANTFYGIMSKLMKMDMKSSSDFKLIDRKVVNVLLDLKEHNTFFRALTFWAGFKTTKVYYDVKERAFGTTKWSFKSLLRYAINNVTSFSTLPLQAVTIMGIVSILFSIVLGIQTLVKFFMGTAQEGFTTVILLILIVGGFIMISLGIIGHYIAKIYEEVKGRPKYIIRDVTENVRGNIKDEDKE
mgnify:CR=1 FL=1